jgi:hypothetical protein
MGKTTEKAEAATGAAQVAPVNEAEVKAELKATSNMETPKAAGEAKIAEGSCPDVTGKTSLNNFHELMHPMHMALQDGNYAEIRSSMPKLQAASEGVATYKCPMDDKCSPECKAKFEAKKTSLLKSVKTLNLACQGSDDKMIDESFGAMHAAYIDFAGMCNPKAEGEKKVEGK